MFPPMYLKSGFIFEFLLVQQTVPIQSMEPKVVKISILGTWPPGLGLQINYLSLWGENCIFAAISPWSHFHQCADIRRVGITGEEMGWGDLIGSLRQVLHLHQHVKVQPEGIMATKEPSLRHILNLPAFQTLDSWYSSSWDIYYYYYPAIPWWHLVIGVMNWEGSQSMLVISTTDSMLNTSIENNLLTLVVLLAFKGSVSAEGR